MNKLDEVLKVGSNGKIDISTLLKTRSDRTQSSDQIKPLVARLRDPERVQHSLSAGPNLIRVISMDKIIDKLTLKFSL